LLADEVSTMIVAGHETTALTLFWMCTLLAKAPQWQTAIAEEASGVDLSAEGAATSLPKLMLTRAVVEETLRLYSPAFMTGRFAQRTHEICGARIAKGSMVLIPYWLLHRNPRWWPNSGAFDPSRFLSGVIDPCCRSARSRPGPTTRRRLYCKRVKRRYFIPAAFRHQFCR